MTDIARGRRAHLSLVPPLVDDGRQSRARPGPTRRRQPRRADPVTYTLRIALDDIEPEIWRRFTVPSDLMLDALHPVLQTVMGWNDSQPHCFISAAAKYSADSQRFDMRPGFDVRDGPEGYEYEYEYEDTVRLDELLAEAGDLLFYEYNFDDAWQHTIVLEAVATAVADGGPACLGGTRNCPPEHAGGAYGYAQLLDAFAPAKFFATQRGQDWPTPQLDPERFIRRDINGDLRRQTRLRALYPEPGTMGAALLRLIPEHNAPEVFSQLDRAHLADGPAQGKTAADADLATAGLRWLLGRIGDAGLPLTPAGYLPPADVDAARAHLGWDGDPGRVSRRESDCHELLDLRSMAEFVGLTRTEGRRLLRTTLGDELGADAASLLAHLADALPAGTAELEREAGAFFILLMACGVGDGVWAAALAQALTAKGWRTGGQPVDPKDVFAMAGPTVLVAKGLQAFGARPGQENGRWGRELARMVLLRPRG